MPERAIAIPERRMIAFAYPGRLPVFTTATRDQVLAILVSALSPYVGATMASASVRGLYQKLELEGAQLGRGQIERLIDALAPGLHVYVGKEKALMIVAEIRAALDAVGASR